MERQAAIVVIMTGMLGLLAAPPAGCDDRLTRVRGASSEMWQLIREADGRSATFRALVDEIQRSNAIVIVQFGLCAGGRFRSCLVGVEGDARQRHIRIRIAMTTLATHYRLMATIAHELQHAVEIVRDPQVMDRESAMRLYRRIATGDCGKGLSEECETNEALAIETRVLDEVQGNAAVRARR